MSDPNILMKMTFEKSRLIEEMIIQFLGYKPTWKERKAFSILNKLDESSVYYKGKYVGTVRYQPIQETVI
jgi:hypothetical protein